MKTLRRDVPAGGDGRSHPPPKRREGCRERAHLSARNQRTGSIPAQPPLTMAVGLQITARLQGKLAFHTQEPDGFSRAVCFLPPFLQKEGGADPPGPSTQCDPEARAAPRPTSESPQWTCSPHDISARLEQGFSGGVTEPPPSPGDTHPGQGGGR